MGNAEITSLFAIEPYYEFHNIN